MELLIRVLVGLMVAVAIMWLLPYRIDWLIALIAFVVITFAWDGPSGPRYRL